MSQIATTSHIQSLLDNEVYITFRYRQEQQVTTRVIRPLTLHISNKNNKDIMVGKDLEGNIKSFFVDQIYLCNDVPQAPKRRRLLSMRNDRMECQRQLFR